MLEPRSVDIVAAEGREERGRLGVGVGESGRMGVDWEEWGVGVGGGWG